MKLVTIAHLLWKNIVEDGDTLIDATMGNGHDTLFLAQLLKGKGFIYSYDIQMEALAKTKELLYKELAEHEWKGVHLKLASHITFDPPKAKLIVYNLGYLPGGDKTITTRWESTEQSLYSAISLIEKGGAISITSYVGHSEGRREHEALLEFIRELPKNEWSVLHTHWKNRENAPELFLMVKTARIEGR